MFFCDFDETALFCVRIAWISGSIPRQFIEYPVDKISFLSASTRTAPTQNFVGAGGDNRAFSKAYSI